MELTADACYQALQTHDRRFDGVFFVGVTSTGIYCRPVCPARTPQRKNCRFFAHPALAEKAGFRPCLRCRPELAPGQAKVDSEHRLAALIASRIEDGALAEGGTTGLAASVGVSERHLRRIVQTAFGVSPIELAQTQRLLLAKRLLTDTDLPVTEIAFASGFQSLRRFNALFKAQYRLNPTCLRRQRQETALPDTLVCDLAYCPPLDSNALLTFLCDRTSTGTEAVRDGRYHRLVRIGNHQGWIVAEPLPERPIVRVTISTALAPVLMPTLAGIKRLFDLNADPKAIADHLGAIAVRHPGLRVPGAFDPFEMAIRAILGQQITVKAAATLSGRFNRTFGDPIVTPFAELTHFAPTVPVVARLSVDQIASLGIFAGRARTILALARAILEKSVSLKPTTDIESTICQLLAIPGIGRWTAQYIAMRALSWPDAFPEGDLGLAKALDVKGAKRLQQLAEKWRPWRSYAVIHLWKSLETSPNEKER